MNRCTAAWIRRPALQCVALLLSLLATAAGAAAHAQAPAEKTAEDQQLESLLSASELFFKSTFNASAQRWEYQVAWSEGGDTSILNIYVRELATMSDGSRVCVAYIWSPIVGVAQGEELPPAIIKAVAATNDNLLTGNISAVGTGVYANAGVVMKDLTADALWMYLWALHDARVVLKKDFEKILAGG